VDRANISQRFTAQVFGQPCQCPSLIVIEFDFPDDLRPQYLVLRCKVLVPLKKFPIHMTTKDRHQLRRFHP
jgi:hypothetical protein